jgi:hypothetical protein
MPEIPVGAHYTNGVYFACSHAETTADLVLAKVMQWSLYQCLQIDAKRSPFIPIRLTDSLLTVIFRLLSNVYIL